MKTLFLLRHAKSSWDDPDLSDFNRPLNNRGLKAAPKMGAMIRKRKLQPEVVLSSPALRAKQTTEIVCEAAGLATVVCFEPEIYEATPQRLLKIVQGIDDQMNSAMLVGHNPGFEELLAALTAESQRMPTAALACIELSIDKWCEVLAGTGRLEWLVTPKLLK
jgi:phosphohistidine phosphatase